MADLVGRTALEQRVEREMSRLSADQRRRLVELMGDPPDPANVPDAFWAEVEAERREKLAALLLLIFLVAARQHGAEDKGGAAAEGAAYAERRAAEVAAGYVQTSREGLARLARAWRERMGIGDSTTAPALVGVGGPSAEARPWLPGPVDAEEAAAAILAPSRDENAGITETTAAASAGGEMAIRTTVGISQDDLWITEKDGLVCPRCGPLHEQPRSRWQGYAPDGPPLHPRCRCFLRFKGEKQAKAGAA